MNGVDGTGIAIGPRDRVVLVGSLSDERQGQRHAFVASWPSIP